MTLIAAGAAVLVIAGIVLLVFANRAPRRTPEGVRTGAPVEATTAWTHDAGDEFGGLSEASRCEMVFAVAALDDERSQQLLEHALDDPAEPVSLAAAHVLAGRGHRVFVEAYLARNPGARADRIAQALALLD
jgi:hypothetical protein